eukprot:gene13126-27741_t
MEDEWVGDYVGHDHFYDTNTSYQLERVPREREVRGQREKRNSGGDDCGDHANRGVWGSDYWLAKAHLMTRDLLERARNRYAVASTLEEWEEAELRNRPSFVLEDEDWESDEEDDVRAARVETKMTDSMTRHESEIVFIYGGMFQVMAGKGGGMLELPGEDGEFVSLEEFFRCEEKDVVGGVQSGMVTSGAATHRFSEQVLAISLEVNRCVRVMSRRCSESYLTIASRHWFKVYTTIEDCGPTGFRLFLELAPSRAVAPDSDGATTGMPVQTDPGFVPYMGEGAELSGAAKEGTVRQLQEPQPLSVGRLSFFLIRALLVLCSLAERHFSRRFDSFDQGAATMICEFDASLEGIGVIYNRIVVDRMGRVIEQPVGVGSSGSPSGSATMGGTGTLGLPAA